MPSQQVIRSDKTCSLNISLRSPWDWSWFVHVSRNDRHEIPCPRLPPVAPGCLGSRRSLRSLFGAVGLHVCPVALRNRGGSIRQATSSYVKPWLSPLLPMSFPCHSVVGSCWIRPCHHYVTPIVTTGKWHCVTKI